MRASVLILFLCSSVFGQGVDDVDKTAPVLVPVVPAPAESLTNTPGKTTAKSSDESASAKDDGEYEIDYEEEPEDGSPVETPEEEPKVVEKKTKKKFSKKTDRSSPSFGSAVSGTRSKNKFAPILSSETKSVYLRNGKALDVDTD